MGGFCGGCREGGIKECFIRDLYHYWDMIRVVCMGCGCGQVGWLLGGDGLQQCKVIVPAEQVIESRTACVPHVGVAGPVGLCAL